LKETLVLVCLALHFGIMESLKSIVGHRDIYYAEKNIKIFSCVEVRIIVEKWNVYDVTFYQGHYYKHADWKRLPCV